MKFAFLKLLALAFVLYTTLVVANLKHFTDIKESEKVKLMIPPPPNIKLMTFGYNENFADSLWLAWAQSPEECGKERISRQEFEKNFTAYKKEHVNSLDLDLGFDRSKRKVCDRGWSFLMLDAITSLAPKFRYAYLVGTTILSVMVDDHAGAALLYDKALKQFPKDWKLHYGAAYHFMYELDDIPKAAYLLRKAGELGAPQWVFSLASKLYSKAQQAFLAVTSLKQYRQYLEKTGDKVKIKEVDERISKLEKSLKNK